jgi:hypothetical protein
VRRAASAACAIERDDEEDTTVRAWATVRDLLLADGTTYMRLATDDAPAMEATLRQAAEIVGRWRAERIAARSHATGDNIHREVYHCTTYQRR